MSNAYPPCCCKEHNMNSVSVNRVRKTESDGKQIK